MTCFQGEIYKYDDSRSLIFSRYNQQVSGLFLYTLIIVIDLQDHEFLHSLWNHMIIVHDWMRQIAYVGLGM
jgi:hypothetical protein